MNQLSYPESINLEHNRIQKVMPHSKYINGLYESCTAAVAIYRVSIPFYSRAKCRSRIHIELYTEIYFFTNDQRNHNYHNIFIRAGFDGQTLKTTLKVTTGTM